MQHTYQGEFAAIRTLKMSDFLLTNITSVALFLCALLRCPCDVCVCAGDGPELQVFLEPLSLHDKDLVLLAVNDNQSRCAAGGTHW